MWAMLLRDALDLAGMNTHWPHVPVTHTTRLFPSHMPSIHKLPSCAFDVPLRVAEAHVARKLESKSPLQARSVVFEMTQRYGTQSN